MNLKPLYISEMIILVGLDDDFREVCVPDGIVMRIDLKNKKIIRPPWSGQRILEEGDFSPIMAHEKNDYRQRIKRSLKKRTIADIEKQLINPGEEAINSLIWKPDRFPVSG